MPQSVHLMKGGCQNIVFVLCNAGLCKYKKSTSNESTVELFTQIILIQGGRCWGTAGPAVPERSGSSPKGRTPNIRYFVAKLSIVAIYALFEWPP